MNSLLLNSHLIVVVLGYLLGVGLLLASVTGFYKSFSTSMQMTIPARLNPLFMLLGFVVIMLTVPMSEALKAGIE